MKVAVYKDYLGFNLLEKDTRSLKSEGFYKSAKVIKISFFASKTNAFLEKNERYLSFDCILDIFLVMKLQIVDDNLLFDCQDDLNVSFPRYVVIYLFMIQSVHESNLCILNSVVSFFLSDLCQ